MRSDAESVDSDVELSQEDAVAIDVQPEEGVLDPPADRESGDVVRAVARFEAIVFVVFGHAYFIMENQSGYPHAKISIHNRLRTEAELGRTTTSKTFATAHHDEAEPPIRTFLALRAWMLWRAHWQGWASTNAAREK